MTPQWVAARATTSLTDLDSWRQLRVAASDRLLATGFPTSRDEAWKYTKASALQAFSVAPQAPSARAPIPPELLGSNSVIFVDGLHAQGHPWPTEMGFRTIQHADDTVGTLYPEPAGFLAANLALARDGAALVVHPGQTAKLMLGHYISQPSQLAALRHTVRVETGGTLQLIERYVGGGKGFTSAVSEIVLEEGSKLLHVRVQDEAVDHLHHGVIGISVGQGAHYHLMSALIGSSTGRVEIDVRLAGVGASADLSGLCLLRGTQHADHHVSVDHLAQRCVSRQQFRSLLDDSSRGIFTGKVMVRKGATGTDASQSHRALLLSDNAIANARPQLEIDNDDVKCAHGASVGALDREALFYLAQRGLDPTEARALLTAAFASEIVEKMPIESERSTLDARIARWLVPS